jgi:hypothetical protein
MPSLAQAALARSGHTRSPSPDAAAARTPLSATGTPGAWRAPNPAATAAVGQKHEKALSPAVLSWAPGPIPGPAAGGWPPAQAPCGPHSRAGRNSMACTSGWTLGACSKMESRSAESDGSRSQSIGRRSSQSRRGFTRSQERHRRESRAGQSSRSSPSGRLRPAPAGLSAALSAVAFSSSAHAA